MEQVASNVQKFRYSFRIFNYFHLTSVVESQILFINIAKHVGKREVMPYDEQEFPRDEWSNHLEVKVLKDHPKISELPINRATNIESTFP